MVRKKSTIIPNYVIGVRGIDESALRRAYTTLLKHVEICHAPVPKEGALEVLVEGHQEGDVNWIEVSPKNAMTLNRIEFNPQPEGTYWRKVPEGLVDVDDVCDAECIEFSIGPAKYRVFGNPGPKNTPKIDPKDPQIPTAYCIDYKVTGGVSFRRGESNPVEQIKILDSAFSELRKHAELHFPIHRVNELYPSIRLAYSGSEGIESLRTGEKHIITSVWLSYLSGRLDHLLLKQDILPKERAVVLGIHGGTHVDLRIGKVNYNIEMTPESILDK